MTVDEAVALSLVEALPRSGLTARLLSGDPHLHELAQPLLETGAKTYLSAVADGLGFLPWNDPAFPAGLLAIPDCPPGLWFRGDPGCLASPAVAIVGSRAGSAVALEVAAFIADGLAAHGVTVVSGLARGVDSAAHRGALRSGRTVAVLGSGVRRIYPSEHRKLAAQIASSGLIVSEYPPEAPPLQFHFPMRNRLISGLCRAVVVVEAAEESGSLITAACALEQGRDVMAVPGNPLSGRNRGGHALIRDGARIVESAEDVLVELGLPCQSPVNEDPNNSKSKTSGDRLLSKLELGCSYDLDGLAALSGIEPARLLSRLSDLELSGRVRRVEGGRFMRTA